MAFCDRDGERGQRVAAELETAGAKVAFTHADIGTEAACLALIAQTGKGLDWLAEEPELNSDADLIEPAR